MQAAIGLTQLNKLDQIIERKRAILSWYQRELDSLADVTFLTIEPGSEYVPFRVVLICQQAHHLMPYLTEQGVQARTFFYPLHKQPCFAHLGKSHQGGTLDLDDATYPNAIYGYEHGILLPLFPTLSEEEVRYICSTIKAFYASLRKS